MTNPPNWPRVVDAVRELRGWIEATPGERRQIALMLAYMADEPKKAKRKPRKAEGKKR